MGKILKRSLAFFMIVLTLATSVPLSGFVSIPGLSFNASAADETTVPEAAETEEPEEDTEAQVVAEGTCADNLKWTLDSEGLFTVSGEGEMVITDSLPWMNYRDAIKTVVIEEGVTSVGRYAFGECYNLTKVTLPETVEAIGEYAFYNCFNMNEINLENVKTISNNAFRYCFELSAVSLDSAVSIDEMAFPGCLELEEVKLSQNLETIGSGCFAYNYGLTEIEIPSSVTYIGEEAFEYNPLLRTVRNFSKDIDVFYDNSYFINLGSYEAAEEYVAIMCEMSKIEYKYDYIEHNMTQEELLALFTSNVNQRLNKNFENYDEILDYMENFVISETVPEYLIVYCYEDSVQHQGCKASGINHIIFGDEELHECFELSGTVDDISWNIDADTETLIISGSGAIPDYSYSSYAPWSKFSRFYNKIQFDTDCEITRIGKRAFYRDDFDSITISASVEEIGSEAFDYSSVSTVTFEEGSCLTKIDEYAFEGCVNLESITLPSSLTTIGYGAFWSCSSLKNIFIPASVTSIGNGAFKYCSSLENITIDEGNTYYSFADGMLFSADKTNLILCLSSKNGDVVLPKEVTSISSGAFSYCTNITSFSFEEGTTITNLPDFSGCSSLKTVNIPKSVTYVYYYYFNNCPSLENINVDEENSNYSSVDGILYNKNQTTLIRCPQGKTVVSVPSTVTLVDDYAFSGCSSLTKIILPESLTDLGSWAFYGCSSLTKIILPESLTYLGSWAFYECSSLTEIILPESLTYLGSYAFEDCSSLKSIVIPENVSEISYGTFSRCTNLESVTVLNKNCVFYDGSLVMPQSTKLIGYSGSTAQDYAIINNLSFESIDDNILESITIKSLPSKKKFKLGGSLDTNGLVITLNYTDGTTIDKTTGFKVTDFDSSKVGTDEVTVTYADKSATFEVEIYEYIPPTLELGHRVTVDIDSNEIVYLEYTPKVSGTYVFSSHTRNGPYPEGYLFDENKNQITSYVGSGYFKVSYYLEAGKKYYFGAGFQNYGISGTYDVSLSAESLECEHTEPETIAAVEATCTTNGYTEGKYCENCGYWLEGHKIVLSYHIDEDVDRVCDLCEKSTLIGSGSYGDEITWTLYDNGDLIFDGTGETPNIYDANRTYDKYYKKIKNAYFKDGITYLNSSVLNNFQYLESVTVYNPNCRIYDNYNCFGSGVKVVGYEPSYAKIFANRYNLPFESLGIVEINYVAPGSDFNYTENSDGTLTLTRYNGSDSFFKIPSEIDGKTVTAIGSDAFEYCTSLSSIEIPDSVTSIGNYAFHSCASLTSITIPEGVTSIGDWAFCGCTNLTSITIPDSVTSIGGYMFYNCTSLESVTIGNSVTSIGDYAFGNCTSLSSIEIPDSVTSIDFYAFHSCASLTSITIPDSVTSIGYGAFSGCTRLESITIPENVTGIGDDAFSNCNSLKSAKIYNPTCSINKYGSVFPATTTIHGYYDSTAEAYASYRGNKFIPLTITVDGLMYRDNGDGTYKITGYYGSNTDITIPAEIDGIKVSTIASNAFTDNTTITSITVSEDNEYYSNDENGVLFNKDKTELILYPAGNIRTSYEIPESVTSIGNSAFYGCTSLESITIPDSVTSIDDYAFNKCTGLTELTMPVSAKIYNSTFGGCSNIEKITLTKGTGTMQTYSTSTSNSGSYTYYGYTPWYRSGCSTVIIEDGVTNIGYYSFYKCTGLKELTMPASAKIYNSSYTFGGCTNIEKITLTKGTGTMQTYGTSTSSSSSYTYYGYTPWYKSGCCTVIIEDGVTNIGSYAFYGCTSLESVTIPDSVTSIGGYAFYNCTSLESVTIPENVTSIGGYMFYNCTSLESVTIGNSVTSIGNCAFENCTSLSSIEIPDGVMSIGSGAFCGCESLTSITIPDSVTSIGNSAFYGCTSLESITIPDSVTSIGDYVFYNCTGLTELTMPASAKIYNSSYTFGGSTNIEKITLTKGTGTMQTYGTSTSSSSSYTYYGYTPWYISGCSTVIIEDGVTNIGSYAFYKCKNLESVSISENVTSIGEYAFTGCTNLSGITVSEGNEYYSNDENGVLFNKDKTELILYPAANTRTSYEIPDSVTSIGNNAFYNCTSLESVTIGNSVTSIGNYAFYGCTSLESITIPDSVTSIGNNAFENCTSLSCIEIPDGVTSIGYGAFYGCTSLESITIPDSVTSIGDSVFYNCTSLASIIIGNSVTSIGDYAFYNCTSLSGITVSEDNEYYSNDEIGVLFNKDKTELILYPAGNTRTSYEIPESVTSIGYGAFRGCTCLESVSIPDSVTSIGNYAFYKCTGLTELTMPASAKIYNSSYTFGGCTNIEKITLTKGTGTMQTYGASTSSNGSYTYYGYTPWYISGCSTVIIEDGVTNIDYCAFYNCTNLKELTMPASAKIYNSSYTFGGCTNIEKITLTKGTGTMQACGTSTIISNNFNTYYGYTPWYISGCSTVVIEDGVTNIGSYAFCGCTSLTNIEIPESVTSIGDNAFYGCTSLESVTIPDSVTSIGDNAFYNCTSLENVSIPDSVTSIGDNAFTGCTNLSGITVSEGNEYYSNDENGVLFNKDKTELILYPAGNTITSYEIPTTVVSIVASAFTNCKNLTSITVPENNEYYSSGENGVLFNKVKTELIRYPEGKTEEAYAVPESVSNIPANAFANCKNLKSVTVTNNECQVNRNAFNGSELDLYCHRNSEVYNAGVYNVNIITLCEDLKVERLETVCGGYTLKKVVCSGCDWLFSTEETDEFTPHTFDNWVRTTEPTCTETGVDTLFCSVCNFTPQDYVEITCDKSTYPESDHNYANNIDKTYNFSYEGAEKLVLKFSSSTATEANYDKIYIYDGNGNIVGSYSSTALASREIVVNSDSFSIRLTSDSSIQNYGFSFDAIIACFSNDISDYRKDVDALGHNLDEEWTVDADPTCTEKGSKHKDCSRCDYQFVEAIDSLGHDFAEEFTVDKEPDCTEKGSKHKDCSRCDYQSVEAIDSLGHDFAEEFTVDKEPDCTEKGSKSRHCSRCVETTDVTDIEALGHDYTGTVTEPTCTEKGYTTYNCGRCNDTYVSDTVDALGHSYESVVTEPNCTNIGYTTYTCSTCGHSYTDNETTELGHEYTTVTTDPTCISQGFTTYTCSRCQNSTVGDIVTALGHDYISTHFDATEFDDGYTLYECSRGDSSYTVLDPAVKLDQVVINAQTHKLVLSWLKAKEATVTGYLIYRKTQDESDFTLVKTVSGRDTLTYTDSDVSVGTMYYYKVCAVKGSVIGEMSDVVSTSPLPDTEEPIIVVFKPANYSVLGKNANFEVRTQDNIGVTKIELYYSSDDGNSWTKFSENSSSSLVKNVSLESLPEADVLVKAIAYDKDGNISDGTPQRVYRIDKTAPDKVQNVSTIEVYASSLTLQWDAVEAEDCAGFILQVKNGDTYKTVASGFNRLGYHLTGLRPQTEYIYRVAAVDAYGNVGEYSDDFAVTTVADTVAPSITEISDSAHCKDSAVFTATVKDECDIVSISVQSSVDGVEWTTLKTYTYSDYLATKKISYTVNFANYAEGIVKVRAIAKDSSGNSNADNSLTPYTEYYVDRTAPAAPTYVKATGSEGYIYLSWRMNDETDVDGYSIYRAESEDGTYTCIKNNHKYVSYYDQNVDENKTYYYKLKVCDSTGNMSEYSEVVNAQCGQDVTPPAVTYISPDNGSNLGIDYNKVIINVSDNNALGDVTVEYRDGIFESYETLKVSSELRGKFYGSIVVYLPVSDYEHGDKLYLRAKVNDAAGLESQYSEVYTYTVDKTAPGVKDLTVSSNEDVINVSWKNNGENDLAGYKIYLYNDEGVLVNSSTRSGNAEKYSLKFKIDTADVYKVSIGAVDNVGNSSYEEVSVDLSKIKFAPVAKISSCSDMEIDVQEYFDASGSADKDGSIYSYHWDFGDGTTSDSIKVAKSFDVEGEYTVTLTVTDDDGLSSSAEKTILVAERQKLGILKVAVRDDLGNIVPYVPVTFNLGTDKSYDIETDAYGVVEIKATEGKYNIGVCVDGKWLPVQKTAVIVGGVTTNLTLTVTEGKVIEGFFEINRLTAEEIKASGIDVNGNAEAEVYDGNVTVAYGDSPDVSGGSYNLSFTSSGGKIIDFEYHYNNGDEDEYEYEVDDDSTTERRKPIAVEEIKTEDGNTYLAVMDIPVQMSYLNELFDVRLHIINNATEDFSILDSTVNLALPEGLEIVDYLPGYVDDNTVEIGVINSRQVTVKWMLRGVKEGLYNLEAEFTGTMSLFNKPVTAKFVSEEPIRVYGASAVNFTFDFESTIKNGAFYFNVGMENVSDIDIVSPKVGITTDSLTNIAAIMKAAESKKKLEEAAAEEDGKKKEELLKEAREVLLDATKYMDVAVYNLGLVLEDATGYKKYLVNTPEYLAPGEKLYNEYVVYGIMDVNETGYFSNAVVNVTGRDGEDANVVVRTVQMDHYGFDDVIMNFENIFGKNEDTVADKESIMKAYAYLTNDNNFSYWLNSHLSDPVTVTNYFDNTAEDFGRVVYEAFKVVFKFDFSIYSDKDIEDMAFDYITELMTSETLVEQIKFNLETEYLDYAKNVMTNIGNVLNLGTSDPAWATVLKDQKAVSAISTELRKSNGNNDLNKRLYNSLNDTAGSVLLSGTKIALEEFLLNRSDSLQEILEGSIKQVTEPLGTASEIIGMISDTMKMYNRTAEIYNAILTIQATEKESVRFLTTIRDNVYECYNIENTGVFDTRVFRVLYNVTDDLINKVQDKSVDIMKILKDEISHSINKNLVGLVTDTVKSIVSLSSKYNIVLVIYKLIGVAVDGVDKLFNIGEMYKNQDSVDFLALISETLRRGTILTAAKYNFGQNSVENNYLASETLMYLRGLVTSRILGEKLNAEYEKVLEEKLTKSRLIANCLGMDSIIDELTNIDFENKVWEMCKSSLKSLVGDNVSSGEIFDMYELSIKSIDENLQNVVTTIVKQRDILFNSKYTIISVPEAPRLTLDYATLKTNESFSSEYQYCFGDGIWKDCNGEPIKFTIKSVPQILKVRKKASGTEMTGNIAFATIYRQPTLRPQVSAKFDGEKYTVFNLDDNFTYDVILSDSSNASFKTMEPMYTVTKENNTIVTSDKYDYIVIRSQFSHTYMVYQSESLTKLVEKPVNVNITVEGLGSIECGSIFFNGDIVNVKANSEKGYTFHGWYLDGSYVGNEEEFEFSAYEGATLEASFREIIPESVRLSAEKLDLTDTDTATLTVEVLPGDAYDTSVSWSSSNENVATVDNNGNITALSEGKTVITATAKYNVFAQCTVTVKHVHVFGEWFVNKKASCTEDGEEIRKCIGCDETETRIVNKLSHSYNSTVTAPTCTSKGFTTYICIICLASYIADEVKELGHSYSMVVTNATCTTKGYTTHTCSVCGNSYVDGETKELGHSLGDYVVITKPTCTEKGSEKSACSRCDYSVSRPINETGHKEVVFAGKKATCTEKGLTDGEKCSVCGITTVAQKEIPATGHKETAVAGKAATCTEKGLTDGKKCSECGVTTVAQKEIAATGHKEAAVSGKAATCTEKGLTDGKKCSECGVTTVAQKEIAATGHKEAAVSGKAATCTEKGLTDGKKCSVCGITTVAQKEISATGHKEVTLPAKSATYKATGLTEGKKCSTCGTITVSQKKTARKKLSKVKNAKVKSTETTSIKLSWSKVTGAESYKIYYSTNGRNWKTLTTTKNSVTIKKLKSGTNYSFRVRAYAGKYYGSKSNTVKTATKVKQVAISSVKSSKRNTAVVNWKTVTGASGYVVEYSTSKKFTKKTTKKVTVKKGSTKKTTLKKLKSGTKYYVRVKAYKTVNKKAVYGAASSVKTVKIK